MPVSRTFLMIAAAVVWYGGGVALFIKALTLVRGAHTLGAEPVWTFGALCIGVIAGAIKNRFIFNHACSKNISRIRTLPEPRPWQIFRPGMLVFLIIIIPTGAMMSRAATGESLWMCLVAALDFSIGTALLLSGFMFWKMGAFSSRVSNA